MKPILFNTEMVQAILAGRKTQTRRMRGLKFVNEMPDDWNLTQLGSAGKSSLGARFLNSDGNLYCDVIFPYGILGDILYVRETFREHVFGGLYEYYADGSQKWPHGMTKWKPNIHMPKSAARIFLEITGIRLQRIKSITQGDAQAEGVLPGGPVGRSYLSTFIPLWDKINGDGNFWNKNPWVWVIEFKRIECPDDFNA